MNRKQPPPCPHCRQPTTCTWADEGGPDYVDAYRLHCPNHGVVATIVDHDFAGLGTTCPFCGKSCLVHGQAGGGGVKFKSRAAGMAA